MWRTPHSPMTAELAALSWVRLRETVDFVLRGRLGYLQSRKIIPESPSETFGSDSDCLSLPSF